MKMSFAVTKRDNCPQEKKIEENEWMNVQMKEFPNKRVFDSQKQTEICEGSKV